MKKWNVKNNAGLRPALFFELTHIDLNVVYNNIDNMSDVFLDTQKIKNTFTRYIYNLIDEFFTPFIIQEMNQQKKITKEGNHKEKYANFFLTPDLKWKKGAISIEEKYKGQLECIKKLICYEMSAFKQFLHRLKKDFNEVTHFFKINYKKIIGIDFALSDRHNFSGGIIIIHLSKNKKFLYKPKSGQSELFFREILATILSKQNFMILPRILNKHEYHWEEYVNYYKFDRAEDLKKIYYNFGVLLAICDTLNFSDGHGENFIVSKKKCFIPIDVETMFTNLSYYSKKNKNIF